LSHSSQIDDATLDAFAPTFTVGVDLGQAHDPTAIAVVRKIDGMFQVGHLERLPLQTPYPSVVAHVGRLLARLKGRSELVIDYTGVGRPVADLFQIAGLSPICVTITAGDVTTNENLVFKVPKLTLISRVQALLHSGALRIHPGLPDVAALVEELQSFRATITDSGYFRFGARSGKHDDLVLAVAICCWRAYGDAMESRGIFEFYREQFGGQKDREPEQKQQPPLPEKPAEDPFSFYGFSGNDAAPADVTLRAPAGTSAATGLSSRAYLPDARGLFVVTAEDAKPLIAHGWTRVGGQQA
jgi:hypothetical protein